jgi:hypothetical protein
MINKLYFADTLPALALAGHFTSAEYGDVFADLMQNFLAQAPDHSGDSKRLGYVTSSAQVATASHNLLLSQRHPSLPNRPSLEVTQ